MISSITFWDYILTPIYILLVWRIGIIIRNRKYPLGHPWRTYFIPGLMLKVAGAVFIGLLYQYYYGNGDTLAYFRQSQVMNSAFSESPIKWFNLIFRQANWYDGEYSSYIINMPYYNLASTGAVVSISAIVGIFTFNTFLPSCVLFAAISFSGIWALFRTFASQYPAIVKQVALAAIFIPSTFIWGSGIFKDTVCMFSLGWLTYGVFQLLIERNFKLTNIIATAIGFYLVSIIKIYILIAFVPALGLWVIFTYSHRIKVAFLRTAMKAGILGISILIFAFFYDSYSADLGNYSMENLVQTSAITRDYLLSVSNSSEGSSGYSLGNIDPTPQGMLLKLPQAVNVTLFRPYLWEAGKPIVFLNALEAAIFLLITLKILIKVGPFQVWRIIRSNPNIQFCLIFTIIFAFSIGISTYNFGSLSRYRIPCLPLYGMALVLIYYSANEPDKRLISFD